MAVQDLYNQSVSSTAGRVLHITGSGQVCTLTNQNGTTVKVFRDQDPITESSLPNGEIRYTFHFADGTEEHIDVNGIRSISFDDQNRLVITQDNGTQTISMPLTGETGPGYTSVTDNGDGTFTFNGANGATNFTTPDLRGERGYASSITSSTIPGGTRISISNADPDVSDTTFDVFNGQDVSVRTERNATNNGITVHVDHSGSTPTVSFNIPDGDAITNADINAQGDLILTYTSYRDPDNPTTRTQNVGAISGGTGGGTNFDDVVTFWSRTVTYDAGHYVTDGTRRFRSLVNNNINNPIPTDETSNASWSFVGILASVAYDGTADSITDDNNSAPLHFITCTRTEWEAYRTSNPDHARTEYTITDDFDQPLVGSGAGLDRATADGIYAQRVHTHTASQITDLSNAVASTASVTNNTNKIGMPAPDKGNTPSSDVGTVPIVQANADYALELLTLSDISDVTIATSDLNFLSGVTSNIQGQLDTKVDASALNSLGAGNIVSGVFDVARIPDLDASKITTGTFDIARIPVDTVISSTSTNPVQNLVINTALNERASLSGDNIFTGANQLDGAVSGTGFETAVNTLVSAAITGGSSFDTMLDEMSTNVVQNAVITAGINAKQDILQVYSETVNGTMDVRLGFSAAQGASALNFSTDVTLPIGSTFQDSGTTYTVTSSAQFTANIFPNLATGITAPTTLTFDIPNDAVIDGDLNIDNALVVSNGAGTTTLLSTGLVWNDGTVQTGPLRGVTETGRADLDVSLISAAASQTGDYDAFDATPANTSNWADVTSIQANQLVNSAGVTFLQATSNGDELLLVRNINNWALFRVTGSTSTPPNHSGVTVTLINSLGDAGTAPVSYNAYRDSNGVDVNLALPTLDVTTRGRSFNLSTGLTFPDGTTQTTAGGGISTTGVSGTLPTSNFGFDGAATSTTWDVGPARYFKITIPWAGTNGNTALQLSFTHNLPDFNAVDCVARATLLSDGAGNPPIDHLLDITDTTIAFRNLDGTNVFPNDTKGTTTTLTGFYLI